MEQSVVRWKYSVNFKFNNYRKFNGACYVSIFRNLCGLATNKCCVVGTLISTQFSQIFVRFTWERFYHRRIFTSLWIKKKRQNKTKQNKKAEEKTVIRVRLVIIKFKRHFRTLKTVIALKSNIEISVAWTNFLPLRQEKQLVRLRKPLIYLSIYLSSHNLSLIRKKLTNVTTHFSVVDSPVLVKIGVRFPPLNEEQCNQLKELW